MPQKANLYVCFVCSTQKKITEDPGIRTPDLNKGKKSDFYTFIRDAIEKQRPISRTGYRN